MPISVNRSGVTYARSLIQAGKVDKTSSWSFSAEDGNKLLLHRNSEVSDWAEYGRHFLARDDSADPATKEHYKYPFAKNGKVYRSGLVAIRQRAGQQNATSIFDAAGRLLDMIDKKKSDSTQMLTKEFDFELKSISEDDGTFSGYGAVFGNIDRGGDIILPGAFTKSINSYRTAGKSPKMLWHHDLRQPIGVWTSMAEDNHGLRMEGRLTKGVAKAQEVHALLKDGAIDGLSIGYLAVDYDYNSADGTRELKELDLYEVSVVTIPMNGLSTVNEVKSAENIHTIRDFENFLRDAGGFSITAAKSIAAGGFKSLNPRDEDSAQGLLEELRQLRAGFTA